MNKVQIIEKIDSLKKDLKEFQRQLRYLNGEREPNIHIDDPKFHGAVNRKKSADLYRS